MPFILSYPLTQIPTARYGFPKGTAGRGGYPLVGICLHELGLTMEEYIAYLQSPGDLDHLRPGEHASVHYAVSAEAALYQFVADANSPWGIRTIHNPTWPLYGGYAGIEPNYLFIQIGLESFGAVAPLPMFLALAQLVAYIATNHSLTIDANHVIVHSALDDAYAPCAGALLGNLIAAAQALAAGGQPALPNIAVMASQIQTLQTQVATLQTSLTNLQSQVSGLQAHPAVMASASGLGHIKTSPTLAVSPSTGVASISQLAAAAAVGGTQAVVNGIPAMVQFGTILSDVNSWITPGALWHVSPTVTGLYRLRARVHFDASSWAVDKTIQLDVYKNGALYKTLVFYVNPANTLSAVKEVEGECSILVTVTTDTYDVRVTHNDFLTKTISAGDFVFEKMGA